MINIMLAGVGGQGTVLAAKVLAQAAANKGWQVRTAETIGMAQRGGNVVSHVRMGDQGEEVYAPLVAQGTANILVGFEPAETARVLPYLAPGGLVVTAQTSIQPVTAALSKVPYRAESVLQHIAESLGLGDAGEDAQRRQSGTPEIRSQLPHQLPQEGQSPRLVVVDDAKLCGDLGTRKPLNMIMLASALSQGCIPLTVDDLKEAVSLCVKPQLVAMNLEAIDRAVLEARAG